MCRFIILSIVLYFKPFQPKLVLKQRLSKLIFIGGITENFEFKTDDDTQVLRSCSALLNGELFVFGGYNFRRQVVTLST